jgi:predicted SPOUT superfamily RNA methylase MTH1
MNKFLRYLLLLLGAVIMFFCGYKVSESMHSWTEAKKIEESQVLIEQIRQVAKFIVTENYISEIFTHKEYWPYDFPGFRKKAMIKVNAKVSMGYDLSNMSIEANEEDKTLTISIVPKAEILSIDHDLQYYDISEGVFNTFTEQDFNNMQERAEEIIRLKVEEGALYESAEKQGKELLEAIEFMAENVGWKVLYAGDSKLIPLENTLD